MNIMLFISLFNAAKTSGSWLSVVITFIKYPLLHLKLGSIDKYTNIMLSCITYNNIFIIYDVSYIISLFIYMIIQSII